MFYRVPRTPLSIIIDIKDIKQYKILFVFDLILLKYQLSIHKTFGLCLIPNILTTLNEFYILFS